MKKNTYKWRWDEKLNNTEFKLGFSIKYLIDKNLVVYDESTNEYIPTNEKKADMTIHVNKKGIIDCIFFKKEIPGFENVNLNLEMEYLISEVDLYLDRKSENYFGDELNLMFKDFFFWISFIKRPSEVD